MNNEQASAKLKAISHPARLQVLKGLIKDECNVSRIQKKLSLPQSTISQHLIVLKNQGIIKGRREGNRVCYRVVDEMVKDILKML
jgi:ArsR family transcriptional regulator